MDGCEPGQTHKLPPAREWLANRRRIDCRDAKVPIPAFPRREPRRIRQIQTKGVHGGPELPPARPRQARSFGQFSERAAVSSNETLGHLHLLSEISLIGCEPKAAVWRFREDDRVTLPRVQPCQRLLGQDDTDGVANLAQFELKDHGECGYECNNAVFHRRVKRESVVGNRYSRWARNREVPRAQAGCDSPA